MEWLWFILIGLVVGSLIGEAKGGGVAVIADIAVAVVGAILAGTSFRVLEIAGAFNVLGSFVVATGGALLLILMLRPLERDTTRSGGSQRAGVHLSPKRARLR